MAVSVRECRSIEPRGGRSATVRGLGSVCYRLLEKRQILGIGTRSSLRLLRAGRTTGVHHKRLPRLSRSRTRHEPRCQPYVQRRNRSSRWVSPRRCVVLRRRGPPYTIVRYTNTRDSEGNDGIAISPIVSQSRWYPRPSDWDTTPGCPRCPLTRPRERSPQHRYRLQSVYRRGAVTQLVCRRRLHDPTFGRL